MSRAKPVVLSFWMLFFFVKPVVAGEVARPHAEVLKELETTQDEIVNSVYLSAGSITKTDLKRAQRIYADVRAIVKDRKDLPADVVRHVEKIAFSLSEAEAHFKGATGFFGDSSEGKKGRADLMTAYNDTVKATKYLRGAIEKIAAAEREKAIPQCQPAPRPHAAPTH